MICKPCAAGADLKTASEQLTRDRVAVEPDDLNPRLSDVVGRPYYWTVTERAVTKLHARCDGCSCQHRLDTGRRS